MSSCTKDLQFRCTPCEGSTHTLQFGKLSSYPILLLLRPTLPLLMLLLLLLFASLPDLATLMVMIGCTVGADTSI